MTTRHDHRRSLRAAPRPGRRAFTLVELVVVIVILSILASLTLSGLAGARQRSKIDKTRSTIRKLHEIVIPLYETYVERRIAASTFATAKVALNPSSMNAMAKSAAGYQVVSKRLLVAADLPDLWDDAWDATYDPATSDGSDAWGIGLNIDQARAPNARYQSMARRLFGTGALAAPQIARAMAYESAECLQMAIVRGGHAADAVEQFRADEIGDVDKDGAPEFLDGWGRPISFIRWPTGFRSVLQPDPWDQAKADSPLPADPMDPLNATRQINGTSDRAVVPLIYSGGPNNSLDVDTDPPSPSAGSYGLVTSREALAGTTDPTAIASGWQGSGWINMRSADSPARNLLGGSGNGLTTIRWPGADPSRWAGAVKTGAAREASDTISNHDFITK